MTTGFRPIGYWLKHLDRLIEDSFDRTLGAQGLTRRHWQVLNVLHREPATTPQVARALAPFHAADEAELAAVLADLAVWGWTRRVDRDRFGLTEQGAAARADAQRKVAENRAALARGFTAAEYQGVVDALERMASNLEPAESGRGPDPAVDNRHEL